MFTLVAAAVIAMAMVVPALAEDSGTSRTVSVSAMINAALGLTVSPTVVNFGQVDYVGTTFGANTTATSVGQNVSQTGAAYHANAYVTITVSAPSGSNWHVDTSGTGSSKFRHSSDTSVFGYDNVAGLEGVTTLHNSYWTKAAGTNLVDHYYLIVNQGDALGSTSATITYLVSST